MVLEAEVCQWYYYSSFSHSWNSQYLLFLLSSSCFKSVIKEPQRRSDRVECWKLIFFKEVFFKDFIYLFLEQGKGKEKERERNISVCLPLTWTPLGPGLQPRHVPWLGIEPATLWFTARAQSTELHQPGLETYF